MTPEERAAMLAAMYMGDDEAEDDSAPLTDTTATLNGADKFISFVINGETIVVPSVAYCSHLERLVMAKDGEIASLKGQLGTVGQSVARHDGNLKGQDRKEKDFLLVKSQMKAIRLMVNRHESDIGDVWRELDRKMNLRD